MYFCAGNALRGEKEKKIIPFLSRKGQADDKTVTCGGVDTGTDGRADTRKSKGGIPGREPDPADHARGDKGGRGV